MSQLQIAIDALNLIIQIGGPAATVSANALADIASYSDAAPVEAPVTVEEAIETPEATPAAEDVTPVADAVAPVAEPAPVDAAPVADAVAPDAPAA